MLDFKYELDEYEGGAIIKRSNRALPALLVNGEGFIKVVQSAFNDDEYTDFTRDKRRVREWDPPYSLFQLVVKGEDRIRTVGHKLAAMIDESIVPDIEYRQERLEWKAQRLQACVEAQAYGAGAERAEQTMEVMQALDELHGRGARAAAIIGRINEVFPLQLQLDTQSA